jgi:glycerophosphoryl diester phosphodiesterase
MKIYAHRGSRTNAREHSLAGYLNAINEGADGFECDIRLTKDNELLLWHDKDTARFSENVQVIALQQVNENSVPEQAMSKAHVVLICAKTQAK